MTTGHVARYLVFDFIMTSLTAANLGDGDRKHTTEVSHKGHARMLLCWKSLYSHSTRNYQGYLVLDLGPC